MALKKQILEIDIIGGEGSLTAEEEDALSNYFKKKAKGTAKPKIKKNQPK
ncbi:MAG: hypothetical protein HYZ42_18215, partial [Bacteroidetes bacterium]|nr:hypothetical protein [Bacteroidota bacterium]